MTDASLPAMSSLTYASRSYYWDVATNFQKIFDLGGPELYYRPTLAAPIWQWAGLGSGGSMAIRQAVLRWHSVLFRKHGSDAAILSANGQHAAEIGSAGVNLGGTLVLSDAEKNKFRPRDCASGDLHLR